MHGEAQDSLRATNSLLTGLDRAGKHPNIIFLCTTNMLDSLDSVSKVPRVLVTQNGTNLSC